MSDTGQIIPGVEGNSSPQLPGRGGAQIIRSSAETLAPVGVVTFGTFGATALAPVIDIDRLWEAPPGLSSHVVRALELLKEVIELIGKAKVSDNPIEADGLTQSAQLTLPKLFSCRSIGDGFGVTINSIHFAFTNLHGMPLSPSQIDVIWRVLRELRARPVLSLDQGLQLVEQLEEHGLEVDPSDIAELVDDADL